MQTGGIKKKVAKMIKIKRAAVRTAMKAKERQLKENETKDGKTLKKAKLMYYSGGGRGHQENGGNQGNRGGREVEAKGPLLELT